MKPTEIATMVLNMGRSHVLTAKSSTVNEMPSSLIDAQLGIIDGLLALSTGLRATYMKLEEIERLIKQQAVAKRP
jgi:hypothetical protein